MHATLNYAAADRRFMCNEESVAPVKGQGLRVDKMLQPKAKLRTLPAFYMSFINCFSFFFALCYALSTGVLRCVSVCDSK